MKIVLMHYHLNPGGVTTVIRQQAAAISEFDEILIITGQPPNPSFSFDTIVIPGLDYDQGDDRQKNDGKDAPRQVAQAVETAIFTRWKDGCDILHVHNPTLKKNRNFLAILKHLQKRGLKLFLQIHDFAEDGRPQAYFNDAYPDDCHYGVINSRDDAILRKSGLKRKGLHRIFNTIDFFDLKNRPPEKKNIVLYPIRAIRRKNIGEAMLLSLFFTDHEPLYITLPPNSPADIAPYRKWKNFVKNTDLKVVFEAGLSEDFPSLVHAAKFMITTSITEGFGFCFLEPWIADKLLWGRKLTDICRDFETRHIILDHLYENLRVPIVWLGKKKIYEKWTTCIMNAARLFDFHPDRDKISSTFEWLTQNHVIDFGLLDEVFQQQIVTMLSEKKNRQTLLRLNPFLSHPGKIPNQKTVVKKNRQAIVKTYNRQLYRNTLMTIYMKVATQPVRHRIDKHQLLKQFFNLKTFSLLKWGGHDI